MSALLLQALAAIQAAGASVYAADTVLKQCAAGYAQQVRDAMADNPFDLGNDSLFENWKTIARISQSMAQVESELQKLYSAAASLADTGSTAAGASIALPAPGTATAAVMQATGPLAATDAVIKRPRKVARGGQRAPRTGSFRGNTARLLAYLESVLDGDSFTRLLQSEVARKAGLPQGSIGASIRRLVDAGALVQGAPGFFKLRQVLTA